MHFVMEAQAVRAADARPGQGGDRQRKKARWQPRVSATYHHISDSVALRRALAAARRLVPSMQRLSLQQKAEAM